MVVQKQFEILYIQTSRIMMMPKMEQGGKQTGPNSKDHVLQPEPDYNYKQISGC